MGDLVEKLLIEEYKQVRDEVKARELAIGQMFAVTLTASVTILAAVTALTFRVDAGSFTALNPAYAYAYLAPHGLIIPVLLLLASHRRDIHRAGTYLHVFFEETRMGPQWETRLTKYRAERKGESLNPLPRIFETLWVLCAVGFAFALHQIVPSWCSPQWFVALAVLLMSGALFIASDLEFRRAATTVRDAYHLTWMRIREAGGASSGQSKDRN